MIKNEEYIVTINGYNSEGFGVARVENQVVFVKGAIDKEKLKIKIVKVLKNLSYARINEIIIPSKERIKPDCKYYKFCGGCDLRHMTYEEEVKFKTQKINDAVKKIAKENIEVKAFHKATKINNYRNKSIFPVENNKIGVYKERSHDVVEVEECKLVPECTNQILKSAKNQDLKNTRNIFIRTNYNGEAIVCFITKNNKPINTNTLPKTTGIVQNINTKNTNVVLGKDYKTIYGSSTITDKIGDLKFELSIPSFFQINRDQANFLYNRAIELADCVDKTVCDLYCGTGTITLFLAKKAIHVTGIEIVPEAIDNAKRNAKINNIDNVDFICADASKLVKADIYVVDPPRKGLNQDTINNILKVKPKRIIYISCNPATLARDINLLKPYKVKTLEAVDMFPRTKHVECICLLEL